MWLGCRSRCHHSWPKLVHWLHSLDLHVVESLPQPLYQWAVKGGYILPFPVLIPLSSPLHLPSQNKGSRQLRRPQGELCFSSLRNPPAPGLPLCSIEFLSGYGILSYCWPFGSFHTDLWPGCQWKDCLFGLTCHLCSPGWGRASVSGHFLHLLHPSSPLSLFHPPDVVGWRLGLRTLG